MIGQVNLALWALIDSFRNLRRSGVWMPFILMFAAQALVLAALTQAYQPILSWFMLPVMAALGAPGGGVHYPELFVILPALYARMNLVVDWLLGTLLFSVAFLVFYRMASGAEAEGSWERVIRVYPRLLLARLPVIAIVLFIYYGLPQLVGGGVELRGNTLRFLRYGSFLGGIVGEGLFIFAPLAILVHDRPLGPALGDAIVLGLRNPVATFLIIAVPNLVQIPISAVMRRSPQIVQSLAPETIGWLLLLGAAAYVLINFVVIAAAVRVFGARYRAAEGGASWAA